MLCRRLRRHRHEQRPKGVVHVETKVVPRLYQPFPKCQGKSFVKSSVSGLSLHPRKVTPDRNCFRRAAVVYPRICMSKHYFEWLMPYTDPGRNSDGSDMYPNRVWLAITKTSVIRVEENEIIQWRPQSKTRALMDPMRDLTVQEVFKYWGGVDYRILDTFFENHFDPVSHRILDKQVTNKGSHYVGVDNEELQNLLLRTFKMSVNLEE